MILTKIIQGQVEQRWQKQGDEWVCIEQSFKPYDQVDWEDQDGKVPCFMPLEEYPTDMKHAKSFKEGQIVSLDTDHDEWGRVCGQGRVMLPNDETQDALVEAFDVRANIIVPYSEMFYTDEIDSPSV